MTDMDGFLDRFKKQDEEETRIARQESRDKPYSPDDVIVVKNDQSDHVHYAAPAQDAEEVGDLKEHIDKQFNEAMEQPLDAEVLAGEQPEPIREFPLTQFRVFSAEPSNYSVRRGEHVEFILGKLGLNQDNFDATAARRVREFQIENGLRVTGSINRSTWDAILRRDDNA